LNELLEPTCLEAYPKQIDQSERENAEREAKIDAIATGDLCG